ncbi:unnamed protein product, partial [Adineta ricciae]
MYTSEPTFGSDDYRCENEFVTQSCVFERHSLISELIFSSKDESLSNECWSAFQYYLDENEYKTLVQIQTAIYFLAICDDVQELRAIEIDGQNHTDETECQQWKCDNIYTRCDGIWNCLDGRDEIECDSLPVLFNCSSEYRICVTQKTFEFTCLSKHKLNDGKVDCLGGTDEPKACEVEVKYFMRRGFNCMINDTPNCLETYELCDEKKDCSFGDDEQFCLQNRSTLLRDELCRPKGQVVSSNIEKFICKNTVRQEKLRIKHFIIEGFHETSTKEENTIELFTEYKPISLLDSHRYLHGLDLRVWLNKSTDSSTSTCLCPLGYYGNQCQYQNQRLSLSIRFHVRTESWKILFAILVLLIDDTNQRIIHSYEQFTYLSLRDCQIKFNLHLFYTNRPKDMNRNYSIHIDIYEKSSLTYRGSFLYLVKFLFLPVHRLAFFVDIPLLNYHKTSTCSTHQCQYASSRY